MNEMTKSNLGKAKNLILNSESIAIIPSEKLGNDAFTASAGLYNMLKDKDKDVYFVYTKELPEDVKGLIDENKVVTSIENRELLVSIDYSGTEAASAHYSTENDVLNVRIGPIPGDFNANGRVRAKLEGFDVNTIVFVGDQNGNQEKEYNFIENADIIKISNKEIDAIAKGNNLNNISLIDETCNNLSEQIFKIASLWGFVPGKKASTALLRGLSS